MEDTISPAERVAAQAEVIRHELWAMTLHLSSGRSRLVSIGVVLSGVQPIITVATDLFDALEIPPENTVTPSGHGINGRRGLLVINGLQVSVLEKP